MTILQSDVRTTRDGAGLESGRPLRVTHAVLTLDVGGLERVVLSMIRRGRARGQVVSVLCLEEPGALASTAEAEGAEVVALRLPPGLRRPGASTAIDLALRKLEPDVLHSHQIGALYQIGALAGRASVPVVVHTEHGDHVSRAISIYRRLRIQMLQAVAARHSDRLFGVSPDVALGLSAFGVIPRGKVTTVSNGIDTSRFMVETLGEEAAEVRRSLGIPTFATVVGTIGRLAEVKQQDILLRGFARVLNRVPEARLLIVGDGPLRSELESLAGALGLADRASFVGYQSRPEPFLRAMDVFALTSRSEGMPLAILEAWAAGVPVVASRVGGVTSLVEHDRTGLLVDPGQEGDLADSLTALLDDRALGRRISQAAQTRALNEFDEDVMAATYENHYREVLARRRPRR